ncbi:MAG TPA: hypothetical protein VGG03_03790 [Thermoanaerobaculia bacterium]
MTIFSQQFVAHGQRGFDRVEPLLSLLETAGVLGGAQIRPLGESAAGEPQGKGQPAAEAGDLVGLFADPRRDPEEQVAGILERHLVQVPRDQAGEREMEPGGHQQQGAWRGDQRLDLLPVGGVVHEKEDPPTMQDRTIERRQVLFGVRDTRLRVAGPHDVGHHLRGGQGLRVHALEVEVELGVRVERLQLLCELQGEDGLTNAANASETEDRAGAALGECGPESGQVLLAAGEVGGRGGELVKGGNGGDGPDIGDLVSEDLVSADGVSGGMDVSFALDSLKGDRSPRS